MVDIKGFEAYMTKEKLSRSTKVCYVTAVNGFFRNFKELSEQNVILWKEQLSNRCKPRTVNAKLTGIERYCKYKGLNLHVKRVKVLDNRYRRKKGCRKLLEAVSREEGDNDE